MTIELSHTQRLNLHALLGAQHADLASIRALWTIQDNLALSIEEEKAIELRREVVAGRERVLWNPALSLPLKQFEFTEGDRAHLRRVVETWDGYGVTADRQWLEPLLARLCGPQPPSR